MVNVSGLDDDGEHTRDSVTHTIAQLFQSIQYHRHAAFAYYYTAKYQVSHPTNQTNAYNTPSLQHVITHSVVISLFTPSVIHK